MYEKKISRSFFIVLFVLASLHFSGCRTAVGKYTDESVLEYQRRIAELEGTNRALTERLGQYDTLVTRTVSRLEAVRERASGIADSVERIEYLFSEYERTVQQLIYELRANGGKIGTGTQDFADIIYCIVLLDGSQSFADYSRVYLACYQ